MLEVRPTDDTIRRVCQFFQIIDCAQVQLQLADVRCRSVLLSDGHVHEQITVPVRPHTHKARTAIKPD